MIHKVLKVLLVFTLLMVVSAAGFYYPMFKEAVGAMPDISDSKKIKGCKSEEQVKCWKKVLFINMNKDYFYPTKQSLVMSYFLFYQYEIKSIKDPAYKKQFSQEALGLMTSALDALARELQKEKNKPLSARDLFIPFSQFYRFAQLKLAGDSINLAREKVMDYQNKYQ
jgi:hypothetical protein